jgi:hypothetical protein
MAEALRAGLDFRLSAEFANTVARGGRERREVGGDDLEMLVEERDHAANLRGGGAQARVAVLDFDRAGRHEEVRWIALSPRSSQ